MSILYDTNDERGCHTHTHIGRMTEGFIHADYIHIVIYSTWAAAVIFLINVYRANASPRNSSLSTGAISKNVSRHSHK